MLIVYTFMRMMKLSDRVSIIHQLLRWRLRWDRHDLDYCPDGLEAGRFVSARAAAVFNN